MADAIFDSSGNVSGGAGPRISAWSGAGQGIANLLAPSTSGISDVPSLLPADSEMGRAMRQTTRYSYPQNINNYAKIMADADARAAQAQAEAEAAAKAAVARRQQQIDAYKNDNIVNLLSNPDPAAQETAYQKLIAQRNSPGPGVASYSPVVSEPRQQALESMGLSGVSRSGEGALPTSGQRTVVDDFARTRYNALKDMGLVM